MRPFHIHARPGGPRRHTQTGRPARPLGGALRLLPIGTLLAWQLTVAVPAQARAGDLDPGFGTGGKVKLDFTGEGGNDVVNALAVQANGRLVAGGHALNAWALARFRQDGTLDPSFGTGGKVTTALGGQVRALVVQADGKLVAAGAAGSDFALARYNPDGTLDAGFGTDGIVTTAFPGVFFAGANALAVQPDGKLVAAGHAATAAFALARYKTDGTLDAGFGTGGIVTTAFGGFFNRANALAVQDNGKLVAAGSPNNFFGFGSDFGLARYLAG